MTVDDPPVPRYGERSLADLVPALFGALRLEGFGDRLGIGPLGGFCLLLIDNLGYQSLLARPDLAPFMAEAAAAREPLTAAFPSTTAASLGSLGTGRPPGEHGLVGYTFAVPGQERPMNVLLWELYGTGPHVGLAETVVPERFQPLPTLFERAEQAGATVTRIGPLPHDGTGFTRSCLRGGKFVGAYWFPDLRSAIREGLADGGLPRTVYAYHPELDQRGHAHGVGSEEWSGSLKLLDRLAQDIAGDLPGDCALVVTGDHGMVNLDREGKIDLADAPDLAAGVRMLAGEARARHIYVEPGAEADVLAAWRESLADRMWVASREEAIEEGWFGPRVRGEVRPRIGDVVAAARHDVGVFQRDVDPLQYTLVGHHGSMTPAEQLVPLIVVRP